MQSLKRDVELHGYAVLRECCPEIDTLTLAMSLGVPIEPWAGGTVQDLVPRETATPNTYSGIYGLGQFPFHTDLAHWRVPPRYLLLRCVAGYADIPTLLLDGEALFEAVTLDILTRAVFKPRRPVNGSLMLLRLCEPKAEGLCFRWDEVFLRSASPVGDLASSLILENIRKSEPLQIALVGAGDTLLVDNWRMLHARSPIPLEREDRKIQRIYLESLH